MNTGRLAGRVAIVTGAGHGIGLAYAERFAEEGAAVVIAELDARAGSDAAASLRANGHRALAVETDVADGRSVEQMVAAAVGEFGRVDIAVNNAAMFASVPVSRVRFDQIDPMEWDAVMRVNVGGVWNVSRFAAGPMTAQGYGKIINISSDTVFKPVTGFAHYVASKAAVVGLTRVMSQELGPAGIRVNCIAPTSVLSEADPDDQLLAVKELRASGQAIAGVLQPSDVVGTALYLASDESDFVTGQTILVNGGAAVR